MYRNYSYHVKMNGKVYALYFDNDVIAYFLKMTIVNKNKYFHNLWNVQLQTLNSKVKNLIDKWMM